MLAVARAIRNRGHLNGVYGIYGKHVDKQPREIWKQAERAWQEAQTGNKDITKGATGWGTDSDIEKFKKEGWWKRAIVTVRIGNHTFYKDPK